MTLFSQGGLFGSTGGGSSGGSSGAYPNVSAPSIMYTGDSEVSQADSNTVNASGTTSITLARRGKFSVWLDRKTGGATRYTTTIDPVDALRKGTNAGVGGDKVTPLYNRLTVGDSFSGNQPLLSRPEQYVFVMNGTNNINAGDTLALLQNGVDGKSGIIQIIAAIIAAGKRPIMSTVLPRNNVDGGGGFDWSNTNGGTTTAAKRLVLSQYNEWLMEYCREMNVLCVPWHFTFSDAAGQAMTGYTEDGLHPSQRGGHAMYLECVRTFGFLLPQGRAGQLNAYDLYNATTNPTGNVLNGLFIGTAGATSDAGGTGTITGTVPTNWRLTKSVATTTSVLSEIVARNDGLPGNVVQLTFTAAGTGSAAEDWRFEYWSGSTSSLSGYATYNDIMDLSVELEVLAGHNGVFGTQNTRVGMSAAITAGPATTISFDAATNTINSSANAFTNFVANRAINVAGAATAGNNKPFKVLSATASTLTIDPSTPVITEAAGNSITVRMPSYAMTTNSSNQNFPLVNPGVFTDITPTFIVPYTGNIVPRIGFFINGNISGTAVVRIAIPNLCKKNIKPSLLNYTATDV